MYKLLIVDDEEIEREGMAQFIPWQDYDIELVGTAANGVEGLDKIQACKPDIVLTDIKMPVMDGLEMIRRAGVDFPELEFIVLSGYGEYEFTSQAMAAGIRHYILKPCDEEKISKIIELVKAEIDGKRKQERQQQKFQKTVKKLLPKAKAQILRNMLLGWEQSEGDYELFLAELVTNQPQVFLLALQAAEGFDYLEYFVLDNVLDELLEGEGNLASTTIQNKVFFLLDKKARYEIDQMANRLCQEYKRFSSEVVMSAVSESGELSEVKNMHDDILELFRMGANESPNTLLQYALFQERKEDLVQLFDYKKIQEAGTYDDVLFECYLGYLKMRLLDYSYLQKRASCDFMIKVLYGESAITPDREYDAWNLLIAMSEVIAEKRNLMVNKSKSGKRIITIFQEIYRYLDNPDLSIQFLAKEILFMNEDHFGRIFYRNSSVKFSAFILKQRVELAKRILQTDIEIKISVLGEQLGFAPDGQYFSKVFRKMTDMSPKEYKDMVRKKTD